MVDTTTNLFSYARRVYSCCVPVECRLVGNSNAYSASFVRRPHLWSSLEAFTQASDSDHVSYQAWHGWIPWIAGSDGFQGLETKRVHPQRWISIQFRAVELVVAAWPAEWLACSTSSWFKRCFMTSRISGSLIRLLLSEPRELVLQGIPLDKRFDV